MLQISLTQASQGATRLAYLLEIVLQYVGQNQSEAARILALSRGTLRKKMKQCGLLPSQHKKVKKRT